MLSKNIPSGSRLGACLLLAIGLAACSRQEAPAPATATAAAPATPTAGAESTAAAPAQAPTGPVVAAAVQAMGVDKLRDAASQALRENRMYAPAGDNAMEYYLALRDKLPDDASVSSALTDLMPYTVIAAEQAVAREQFDDAQRLVALIGKADASAPALPRIRQSIVAAQDAVAKRAEADAARTKAQAEAQVLAQQEAAKLAVESQAAAARLLAEQQEAARQAQVRREAEQREAEQREAAERQAATAAAAAPAPARTQSSLRPISTPAPRFPAEALRAGTAGEVLVEFTVGTDGSVTDARVLRSSPARTFDREALSAVRRWRFEPVDAPVTTRRTVAFNPGG